MERPHGVIEKKLHELEMQFADLFFPPANSTNPRDQERLPKEIEARVDFLKNLLSIEKECHRQDSDQSHLAKLEERLDGLDTAFHDWMEGGEFLKKDVPGSFSGCSCTRSCFSSEDKDEDEEDVNEEEEKEKDEEEEGIDMPEKEKDQEEESIHMPDMEKDEEEEGFIDRPETECLKPEIKEDSKVSEVERSDEGKIGGDEKKKGYHRSNFSFFVRIVALVGAVVVVAAGATVLISEVFGGFGDEVLFVPT